MLLLVLYHIISSVKGNHPKFLFFFYNILYIFIFRINQFTDYVKINPIISGYMSGDIKLGNSFNTLLWDSATIYFNIDLDIPDLSYGNTLSLDLTDFKYNINFQVGWMIGYDTCWGSSWLFGEGDEYVLKFREITEC